MNLKIHLQLFGYLLLGLCLLYYSCSDLERPGYKANFKEDIKSSGSMVLISGERNKEIRMQIVI